MPIPDLGPSRSSEELLRVARDWTLAHGFAARLRRGRKRPDGEAGETVPVEPNRPLDLSGGAAAALTFDD